MSIDNPTTPLDRALGAEERANERVCELEDLRDVLQAKATRLEGEATVLRQLLREASNVITTIVPEDDTETLVLEVLQSQIEAALKPPTHSILPILGELDAGKYCTCLGSQLGPHYCEVHAA